MFARSSFAAFVLAAVCGSVNAQFPDNCGRVYFVVAGDTCDGISAKENVSTFQLANVNRGTIDAECSNLFVGQKLCLGITGQDCQVTQVVQSGDTCDAIAQAANTTVGTILGNNPNVDIQCTNMYSGEVLCTATEFIGVPGSPPTTTAATGSSSSPPSSTTLQVASGYYPRRRI